MDKPRNNGTWTEARYKSFIKGLLRKGTTKWGPKNEVKKEARVERGVYQCKCGINHPASVKINGKRVNNIYVDHKEPIIDPEVGFTTWDDYIEKMFCERDNLQVMCLECHSQKTAEERKISTERARQQRIKEKENKHNDA